MAAFRPGALRPSPVPLPVIAAATALVCFLSSACAGAPTEVTADEPEAITPETGEATAPANGFNDPSADADRAPDEPRQVPRLVLPTMAPGSDAAAEALLDDLERFITADQRRSGVPWPALRQPDPVEAYRAAAAFQGWMVENNPTPTLVEAYTASGSPERDFDVQLFGDLHALNLRSAPATPPYSMRVEALVHPAATGITDTLLAQVPDGSAAIVYWDSVGPSDVFTVDGHYWDTNLGWNELGPWVAIMAPTDVGWQVWWDELSDPPPPGSREQQGAPRDAEPRRDL